MAFDFTPLAEQLAFAVDGPLAIAKGGKPRFEVDPWGSDSFYNWATGWQKEGGRFFNVEASAYDLYNVEARYVGPEIDRAEVNGATFSSIILPTFVGELDASNLLGSYLSASAVEYLSLSDIFSSSASVGWLGDGYIEDIHQSWLGVDYLSGRLMIDDGENIFVNVNYSNFGIVQVNDVQGGEVRVNAGKVDMNVYGSNDLTIDLTGTYGSGVGVVWSGWESPVIVLGGAGNDSFDFFGSRVAYNPGAGKDYVNIEGGNTIGNGIDGDPDTFVFKGGRHSVEADGVDQILIDTGAGWWDVASIDAIDGNENGVAEWYGADGGLTTVAFTFVETYDDWLKG